MKKPEILMICITIAFIFGITGFFIGRNDSSGIHLSDRPTDPNQVVTDGKIDINTASASQLQLLPGIGKTIAENIVSYRQENGPYTSVYDLLNVDLIGETRLNGILDYITVVVPSS